MKTGRAVMMMVMSHMTSVKTEGVHSVQFHTDHLHKVGLVGWLGVDLALRLGSVEGRG